MIHEDYLVRQIQMMVVFVAKMIFKKDTINYTVIEDQNGNITQDGELYLDLMRRIKRGEINEAENILFEAVKKNPNNALLEIALDFYSTLGEMSDEFLIENNFSREEVCQGLCDILKIYNIDLLQVI